MHSENKVTIDGLIFELQNLGGISRVWATLLRQFKLKQFPFKYVEKKNDAANNLYRQPKDLNFWATTQTSALVPARVRKFIPFSGPDTIFIPTYYRPVRIGVKNVQVCHDCIREDYIHPRFRSALIRRRESIYRNATRIVCISHTTKHALLSIYGNNLSGKVSVIPNPVDFELIDRAVSRPSLLQGIYSTLNDDYAVYLGNRTGAKNFFESLQLLKSFPKLKLVVIGAPFSSEELMKIVDYRSQIIDFGFVQDADLYHLVRSAKFLFFPSLNEGFGFPVIEAMYLGTPVVCRDIPVNRETSLGFANFYDSAESLNAAVECATSSRVRESVIQELVSVYNAEKVCSMYIQLLSQMLSDV